MRCPNCQTLNPPNAKFCLECGNRLLRCPNCETTNPSHAKFCIECGTPLQPRSTTKDALPSSPSALAHEHKTPSSSLKLLALPEERRVVTVMFADITGSTPLADRLDPEDMRAILTGYFNLMTEQIRKHDGTVEKYIGDAIMAVFGAPLAHENDPERALRAALDMQAALTAFNEQRQRRDPNATRLQMRIGINTGEVAAPNTVLSQRQDFLVTGDAVNVAARLQQSATPDTIFVGERTYLSTRDLFEFTPVAPLRLKGKPEPIPAYILSGLRKQLASRTQSLRGILGQQSPLIGRTLELTLLHASYARVQAERRPHLITILGVPGIGKTRLIREFIAHEQELATSSSTTNTIAPLVLKGRCPPYGEGITYWPLVEILRTLLRVQDNETNETLQQRFFTFVKQTLAQAKRTEVAEEIAETLLRGIGNGLISKGNILDQQKYDHKLLPPQPIKTHTASLKTSSTQGALLRAWRVLIEALGAVQPLIIVVDDLQWADEALLDLLEYLTDRITTVPILFLCPARPDFLEHRRDWGGGHRNFTTIELDALTWEESNELVDALLNSNDLPEILRYTILSRAEGNPFFVEEIIRMLIDQGLLIATDDPAQGKLSWHINTQNNPLLNNLSTPGDLPDDALIERHYLLPLPHVPDTIQGVLSARIDLLNPTEKLLLQYAAVIGRTFWLSSLLELAIGIDKEIILETLAALMSKDFVIEVARQANMPVEDDQIFSFKHILIHDVVYNNIPRQRRSRVHAQFALWLEEKTRNKQETFIEQLANHYQQALTNWSVNLSIDAIDIPDPHDPSAAPLHMTRAELRLKTIHYLTLAGDQALHSYYTLRALRAYNDALELLLDSQADPLTRSQMLKKLGDAYAQRGNLDEAWQHYRKALHLITENGKDLQNTNTHYLLTLYEHLALPATRWLLRFDIPPDIWEVREYIDAGLHILQNMPTSREHIAFLTYQAFWYVRQLENAPTTQKADLAAQALASGHQALQLAEELDDPGTLSLTLDAMSFIYQAQHLYKKGQELQQRRQMLEPLLADRDELYDLYFSLGVAYKQIDEYATALTWFGRAWNNALTMESAAMLLNSMVGRMDTWLQWNRWDDAQQVALDILQSIEKYQQDEKRQFWALETLAMISYYRGKPEEGDEYTKRCKRLLEQQAERSPGAPSLSIGVRIRSIYLASEDWTRALDAYKEKLQQSEPLPSPELLATLAELSVTVNDDPHLQAERCERAMTICEQAEARKSLAIALRARGRMYTQQQQWQRAEEDLHHSLQLCEMLDLPWERGHTLYHLGMLFKSRGTCAEIIEKQEQHKDMDRARHHFEQALGFYESLGAISADRVKLELVHYNTVAK